jgi:hypothetical protein
LKVFNISGRLIYETNYLHSSGKTEHKWELADNNGMLCPAGIYICEENIGQKILRKKMVIP